MEKSINEWFSSIEDESLRTNLLSLVNSERGKRKEKSLFNAILSGFKWANTSQGIEYWFDILEKVYNNQIKVNK